MNALWEHEFGTSHQFYPRDVPQATISLPRRHSRARARQVAADAICSGRKPVLRTVEQGSLCGLGGRLAPSRDGAEWAKEFRPLAAAAQVTAERGAGLAVAAGVVEGGAGVRPLVGAGGGVRTAAVGAAAVHAGGGVEPAGAGGGGGGPGAGGAVGVGGGAGAAAFPFLDRAPEQRAARPVAAALRAAAVPVAGLARRPEGLRGAGPRARALVRGVLGAVWRARRLVEGVNSVRRRQPARPKRLTQGLLDLKRLYGNRHAFRAGQRKGSSPYGRLGLVLPPGGWGELLQRTPEQLRQEWSALNPAA